MRFTLGCRTLPDAESANVIGDIPGREAPEEIVLLGAHLDSWDLGTGALDDAAGCGIVIEAARQIGLLRERPRRTVRVVLFANEENGLRGGKAYAEAHAAELASHVAALEADLGQGPPLGFSWNAGPSAEAMLKAVAGVLAPIAADTLTVADIGGADLTYLLPSGIPNLGLLLDATDYFDHHHTANDNFDRIDPKILDRSTAATATLAYVLAEIAGDARADPAGEARRCPCGRPGDGAGLALPGDLLPHRLHLRVLEPEQLGDAPRELVLGGGERPVGVDDAPDHLDQAQPLLAREPLGDQPRELVEVDALAPLRLREPDDLGDVLRRHAEVLANGA